VVRWLVGWLVGWLDIKSKGNVFCGIGLQELGILVKIKTVNLSPKVINFIRFGSRDRPLEISAGDVTFKAFDI
jgi:hypothetical protein